MIRATTILSVRHHDRTVMAGDGQVTFGSTVLDFREARFTAPTIEMFCWLV